MFSPDNQAWHSSPNFHHTSSLEQDEIRRSFGQSNIHAAIVETLLDLFYGLSNHSLADTERETLASIVEAPAWDTVFPHLSDVLTKIGSNIVQAIAEGLLKESIRACHHRMLDLALGLGADPTYRIRHFDRQEKRSVLLTPLIALCRQQSLKPRTPEWTSSTGEMIRSLLKEEAHIQDSNLLWVIRAGFHDIAEDVIRSQPEREVHFPIAVINFEWGSQLGLDTYDSVTLLLVACSHARPSAEKLSLVRCLLERNAKVDLEVMIAAAGSCDEEVVLLLHQHGAPVNGFIPGIGSPLSSACKAALRSPPHRYTGLAAIPLLLRLGASPDSPMEPDLDSWELSPLHILALAEEHPTVTAALNSLLEHGVDINHRARFYRSLSHEVCPSSYGPVAETALEYAIGTSRWTSAIQLLSADCELTGKEILFINKTKDSRTQLPTEMGQERFRHFIGALLAKAPAQAAVSHWTGLTVLQRAIRNEHEDMIQALLEFGLPPLPSDLMYMLCNRTAESAKVCRLSNGVQLKLVLAAGLSGPVIPQIGTFRLILAFACPEVVRRIFKVYPSVYDSEGLCYMISRVVSNDKASYFSTFYLNDEEEYQSSDSLTIDDLRIFISRRNSSDRDEDWESTAFTMAARTGRIDILQILIGSSTQDLRNGGLIPLFLLKEALVPDFDSVRKSDAEIHEWNTSRLGAWIRYCRMDNPNMRCSQLTAAAMVVPETLSEQILNLLLALGYQPDGWTVLVASCQGHLSVLQRLKQLECWPHILNHGNRPDWCPTALQAAVYSGHIGLVRFLLDPGTRLDTMDPSPRRPFCFAPPDGAHAHQSHTVLPRTALQHAVEKDHPELVTLLVNAGANVNAPAAMDSGATALQIASTQGSIQMVEYLLSIGADPQAAGAVKHGLTALEAAAKHGRKDVVELLLNHDTGTTPQHREQIFQAIFYAEKNAHRVVATILRESLVPQWSSEDEETLETLTDDWESSSEISAFRELRDDFCAWEQRLEDTLDSQSFQESESGTSPSARSQEPQIESPLALPDDEFWPIQDMEAEIGGYGAFDLPQIDGIDLYDGNLMSALDFDFQEYDATWVDEQRGFEGYSAEDMLFADSLFNNS